MSISSSSLLRRLSGCRVYVTWPSLVSEGISGSILYSNNSLGSFAYIFTLLYDSTPSRKSVAWSIGPEQSVNSLLVSLLVAPAVLLDSIRAHHLIWINVYMLLALISKGYCSCCSYIYKKTSSQFFSLPRTCWKLGPRDLLVYTRVRREPVQIFTLVQQRAFSPLFSFSPRVQCCCCPANRL